MMINAELVEGLTERVNYYDSLVRSEDPNEFRDFCANLPVWSPNDYGGFTIMNVNEVKGVFLYLLRMGYNPARAAKLMNIARTTFFKWRNTDPTFVMIWEDAYQEGTENLEDIAMDFAKEGNDRLITYLLKVRNPQKFNPDLKQAEDPHAKVVDVQSPRELISSRIAGIASRLRTGGSPVGDDGRGADPANPRLEILGPAETTGS